VVVRYADDLVAMCVSREQAEEVKQRLADWQLRIPGVFVQRFRSFPYSHSDGFRTGLRRVREVVRV
jgi:hypothetical protein